MIDLLYHGAGGEPPGVEMIIQGKQPGTDRIVNILVEGRVIKSVEAIDGDASYDFGGPDYYLCHGFFDPQVNGFAGVDFNGQGLSLDRLHLVAQSLALSGVTRFLPTLITASREKLLKRVMIIADALENEPLFEAMCPGIHLEGPYISPEVGPRGAHPIDFIRLPDWEEVERLQEAAHGKIRCITLAPEVEGSIPFIEKAVDTGIVIGLGHTNASDKIIEDAFRAGARLSSHLGNAAGHRNTIQKQLSMDGLMASIIVDGIHLPGDVVRDYIRAKGVDRVLLTTDCTAGAGAPAGRYTLGDVEVEVRPDDRSARLIGSSRLAGSTLTMDQAVANVIRFAGTGMGAAIQMAGENGGKLFPEVGGEITPGCPADLVLFEYDETISVESTWIRGERIPK